MGGVLLLLSSSMIAADGAASGGGAADFTRETSQGRVDGAVGRGVQIEEFPYLFLKALMENDYIQAIKLCPPLRADIKIQLEELQSALDGIDSPADDADLSLLSENFKTAVYELQDIFRKEKYFRYVFKTEFYLLSERYFPKKEDMSLIDKMYSKDRINFFIDHADLKSAMYYKSDMTSYEQDIIQDVLENETEAISQFHKDALCGIDVSSRVRDLISKRQIMFVENLKTSSRKAREALLEKAAQDERLHLYVSAAKKYRDAGNEESAQRCERLDTERITRWSSGAAAGGGGSASN